VPLVTAVQWWLGSSPVNNDREVTASVLYTELRNLCERLNQTWTFKNAATFGKAIKGNQVPLKKIGMSHRKTEAANVYKFSIDSTEMLEYQKAYTELYEIENSRDRYGTQRVSDRVNTHSRQDEPRPMSLRDEEPKYGGFDDAFLD
jgi:hypothetical protein